MNIGYRIKQRRIELGISADDLAKRVGKSRATIYRYENGDIENMPTPALEPLARALQTTPAELMGWEAVSNGDIGNVFANDNLYEIIDDITLLSPSEKEHFKNYLQLLEINREKADNYVVQLLSLQNMEDDLIVNAAHERTDINIPEDADTSENDIMDDEDF